MSKRKFGDPVTLAWIVQYGYIFMTVVILYAAIKGLSQRDILVLLALIAPFTLLIFFYRCRQCRSSIFYHPDSLPWSLFRISLFRPASERCLKCGSERT